MLHRSRTIVMAVGVLALALVPPAAAALNQPFYVDLFRRMMIFALAALSLDLVLGYGGMVSFGHAAYLGIGAYAVGILAFYGVDNGFLQWSAAIAASAVAALVIGAISIRTSGVYFIMITLAFAQMLYYLGISLETYGGDNGMPLRTRSQFAGLIDLRNPYAFYYLVLALLVLFLVLGDRLLAVPLQARRLRPCRGRVRPRRRAAREPDRVPHPRVHALDPLRRDHVHGDPRRDGHIVRARLRGRGARPRRGRARTMCPS